jgi:hypothetical protein
LLKKRRLDIKPDDIMQQQHTYGEVREPASNYFDGQSRADTWREKIVSERNQDTS